MSKSKNTQPTPRSIRQKQILDMAAENPELTVKEIAAEVSSASPELVERVLGEFGDPAGDEDENSAKQGSESEQAEDIPLNQEDLSSEQLKLLKLISEYPKASQRELGEMLDVSRTTVSNRANSMEGFEWKNRLEFAESILEFTGQSGENSRTSPDSYKSPPWYDNLSQRINSIEHQIEEGSTEGSTCLILDNHDLTHKVLHACLKYESITEEEELLILKSILK